VFTTLISCAELAAHLDDPTWIVFDCRNELVDKQAGLRAYEASRIPGARHVHLEAALSGAITRTSGRHPLPPAEVFCERVAALGLRKGQQVVAYDAMGGAMAARLWWMLRWVGHRAVAVLDGGWNAWLAHKLPVQSALPTIVRGDFSGHASEETVDADTIARRLGDPEMVIVDARAADRFRGENETLDPVGGHIPGARNRPFMQNLNADGTFKSAQELRAAYAHLLADVEPGRVVHQCGSGVTACHNLLAMEHAGLTGSRLYPGSWSEWCADPDRPIARG